MRCHAYLVPSENYRELEAQILQQLGDSDRDQLSWLLADNDLAIELLSGEWRLLFAEAQDFFQAVDEGQRIARLAVSPDELPDFVRFLRDPDRLARFEPIAFGLSELIDALPVDSDLMGLVVVEENDDWMWVEPVSEIQAIRPEVFALLEPFMRKTLGQGDYAALARLCSDHAEAAVEFTPERWRLLREQIERVVPELQSIFDACLADPRDYTGIREAIALVSDPAYQPSLDAWLRVQADAAQYALYFRNASRERD